MENFKIENSTGGEVATTEAAIIQIIGHDLKGSFFSFHFFNIFLKILVLCLTILKFLQIFRPHFPLLMCPTFRLKFCLRIPLVF